MQEKDHSQGSGFPATWEVIMIPAATTPARRGAYRTDGHGFGLTIFASIVLARDLLPHRAAPRRRGHRPVGINSLRRRQGDLPWPVGADLSFYPRWGDVP